MLGRAPRAEGPAPRETPTLAGNATDDADAPLMRRMIVPEANPRRRAGEVAWRPVRRPAMGASLRTANMATDGGP